MLPFFKKISQFFKKKDLGVQLTDGSTIHKAVIGKPFRFADGWGILVATVGKYYTWRFDDKGRCVFDLDWSIPNAVHVVSSPAFAPFQKFVIETKKTVKWYETDEGIMMTKGNDTGLCKVYKDGDRIRVVTDEGRVLEA